MKYTQVSLLLSLSATPVLAGRRSAKTKKGKSEKSSPSVTCPRDSQHAASIGSRMWGEMWNAFIETQCDCEDVKDVWDHYLTDDVFVSILEPALGVGTLYPG